MILKKADIAKLPKAKKVSKKPAVWKIDGYGGRYEWNGQFCTWEAMSGRYKEIFPDGLSVPDSNVIAQSGGHAHKFRPVKE